VIDNGWVLPSIIYTTLTLLSTIKYLHITNFVISLLLNTKVMDLVIGNKEESKVKENLFRIFSLYKNLFLVNKDMSQGELLESILNIINEDELITPYIVATTPTIREGNDQRIVGYLIRKGSVVYTFDSESKNIEGLFGDLALQVIIEYIKNKNNDTN